MDKNLTKITIPKGWVVDKIENGEIILKESKNELPNTWGECYTLLGEGEFITNDCSIIQGSLMNPSDGNRNAIPIGLGKAILAFMQLLICRQVYRQGWEPNWDDNNYKFIIQFQHNVIITGMDMFSQTVLSFQSEKVRDKFLKNFKDLIIEAKEFI